ncbi:hypothetical protein [Leeia sp.]|uniref:hypothetical protein n=1 Tax=Leeia sp. TaxID=2884678 RepID=UPI0035AF9A82
MTWYIASLVSLIEQTEGGQQVFPMFEEYYLFEAHTDAELQAHIAAEADSIQAAGASGLRYCGKEATQRYLGVRQINALPAQPVDGAWLTRSRMIAASREEAERYAQGEGVWLRCVPDLPLQAQP